MSVFHENMLIGASGQVAAGGISRSLRFNSSDSGYCSRTFTSAGNRKTWTWAGWVKRSKLSEFVRLFNNTASGANAAIQFMDSDKLRLFDVGIGLDLQTTQVFRDASAWYHFVIVLDTTQATSSNRAKLYVNGSQITTFSTSTYPSQNTDGAINNNVAHQIGSLGGSSEFFNGYLADIHFIDGQALDPTSFTEVSATTGQLIPKAYTGTYGTNGFKLTFSDNSNTTATTLGKDTSGNGNNWTPNNLSVTAGAGNDSLVDVPTNGAQTDTGAGGEVRGNYCTWNAVAGSGALANGNLDFSSSGNPHKRIGTIGVASSKWYFEAVCTTQASSFQGIGVGRGTFISDSGGVGGVSSSWGVLCETGVGNGYLYHNSSNAAGDIGTINVNDVMMFAVDVDAGKFWVGLNGTWYNSGSPSGGTNATWTGVTGELFPVISSGSGGAMFVNFGQRPFAYTAPSGFKALNTASLPAPLVTKPSTVMDVALYTGTGSALTPTSSLGFNPDLVWIKGRSGATDHSLYDSVRGVEKRLESNTTDAEVTSDGGVTAFNTAGFSVGTLAQVNTSSATYAAWCWDAGSSTVTNTQGSITSSVRANASAGFSIVTYTGTGATGGTVGHGLGVPPGLIICKSRTIATNWIAWHNSFTNNEYIYLSTTGGKSPFSGVWGSSNPTSSVFGVLANPTADNNWGNMVAYCFAPVAGYSNGFSFSGSGSADGPFCFLGFRPRLILLKRSDSTGNWILLDTAREGYNVDNDPLWPNLADAEGTTDLIDITSNGFKVRSTDASVNASGGTYIGFAWAESPFNYARAR